MCTYYLMLTSIDAKNNGMNLTYLVSGLLPSCDIDCASSYVGGGRRAERPKCQTIELYVNNQQTNISNIR